MVKNSIINTARRWLRVGAIALLSIGLSVTISAAGLLPAGNAITDGKAILRYALPIDNKPIREVQGSIEDISNQLRGKRWNQISADIKKASGVLHSKEADILKSVSEDKQAQAQTLTAAINTEIESLQAATEAKDKPQVQAARDRVLAKVGELEELMVAGFPYEVPEEYKNLPQLKGRATIDLKTTKGDITVVVDGYSAPVTAGNFVDLVQRGFYNNLPFTRAEDFYVLQFGDPQGDEVGFIDPKTKKYRSIPLEVLVKGEEAPTYGITLEDAGRYNDEPVLPFSAYGALAMARPETEPNGGSSQVFFFLFEPELTPAGRNLLDGRYSVFGYVTAGKDVLSEIKAEDRIESAKVVNGLENLVKAA
jgi:peptidylprolyl isomerase